jgi:hypothetical protein
MKFVLRNDHKNLISIAEDSNPTIFRWYMALQELDFFVKHIAGSKNLVADWFSRLCFNNMNHLPKEYEAEDSCLSAIMDDCTIPSDKFELISRVHNTISGHHGVNRTLMKLNESFPKWLY